MIDVAASRLPNDTDRIAAEILSALADYRQIDPLTTRPEGLDLGDAYRVTAAVRQAREARGERVIGRKIGFTDRTIWDEYDVHAPIWGYVYDTTVCHLTDIGEVFSLSGVVEPPSSPRSCSVSN